MGDMIYREARLEESEKIGKLLAVALLQQKDFCILSYLLNGGTNIFRYIRPRNLFKYFDFVKGSKKHLEEAGEFDWYLMAFAVNVANKGQGIGSTFLKQGIEPYVRSKGCEHLGLITSTSNNASFYEKNDYVLLDFIELEYGSRSIGNWALLKTMNKS